MHNILLLQPCVIWLFTGGIPVLVLALCSGTKAFKVIAILLSRADLPAEQLVRMQAVPWLCLLLKPDMREQAGVVSTGHTEDAL